MCGLFGSFGASLSEKCIQDSFQTIKHRGPDDQYFISQEKRLRQFTCAAVRLAFRDINNGRQPFAAGSEDQLVVSMNGEIYNYDELLRILTTDQIAKLKSSCDTEVIAPLYEAMGHDFLRLIRGMYAISIWDRQSSTGYLCVDFLAQKPLFFCHHGSVLFYASELTTLACILRSELPYSEAEEILSIRPEGYMDIIKYKCIMGGETIYKGINKLKPGQAITFNKQSNCNAVMSIAISKFPRQTLSGTVILSKSESDILKDIDALLRKAILRRVDPSVDQSIYLSGGLDSSLVASILRDVFPDIVINSFNLSYANLDMNGKNVDSEMALLISKQISSVHHSVNVDPANLADYIPDILRSFGEPFAGVPSMWFVAKDICRFSRYSISGDGADELFGSYFTHREASRLEMLGHVVDPLALISDYLDTFLPDTCIASPFTARQEQLRNFYIRDKTFDLSPSDSLNAQLQSEAEFIFPYNVLTYVDRLSMAHSVEPRSPFLDEDLWRYCIHIPKRFKIEGFNTKVILKRLAEKYIPYHVIYRKKEGFVFPLHPYLLKDKDAIMENIIDYIQATPLLGTVGLNKKLVASAFSDLQVNTSRAFKSAQFLHSLNILSAWSTLNCG